MHSRAIYNSFLLLTALTSVGLAVKCYLLLRPSQESGVFVVSAVKGKPSPRFTPIAHGCGGPNNSWTTLYSSRNGSNLSLDFAQFESRRQATEEIGRRLKSATQIIEKGPKLDGQGNQVGQRYVALCRAPEQRKEWAAILWTEGSDVYAIESAQLAQALDFENDRRR